VGLIKFFTNKRVAVATIFLAITLASIVLGGIALAVFLTVLILLGNRELVTFIRAKGYNPSVPIITAADLVFILLATFGLEELLSFSVTIATIATLLSILSRGKNATIADASTTIMAFMYGGWLPMHILLLRQLDLDGLSIYNFSFADGLGYIIMIFLVITISDIAGYYIGTNFGKTPLCPTISPKKTVEGAVASTIGGILIAIVVGYFIKLSFVHSLIAGILFSLAAQFGDLCESMLKRDAGLKDSGDMLPGHGGVLDRADSYIFTGAVAYYYFKIFVIQAFML